METSQTNEHVNFNWRSFFLSYSFRTYASDIQKKISGKWQTQVSLRDPILFKPNSNKKKEENSFDFIREK